MNVRLVNLLCGAMLLAAPAIGAGQGGARIALIVAGPPDCPTNSAGEAFFRRLGEFGYIAGRTLAVDSRCYGAIAEVPGLLADALQAKPHVIVAGDSQAAVAAKRATATTPIVFMNSSDPVQAGLITSFARPGGNATGVGNLGRELAEKRLELLKQTVPSLARVGVVWNLTNEVHEGMWKAEFPDIGRRSGVALVSVGVRSATDLEPGFARLREHRVEAVLLMPDGLFFAQRDLIVRLASEQRLPTIHWARAEVEAGGLMSYGPDRVAMARQAAVYVAKILKGARAADLPVEQPTKFELVINLKRAHALGLTIPRSLLARADELLQ